MTRKTANDTLGRAEMDREDLLVNLVPGDLGVVSHMMPKGNVIG